MVLPRAASFQGSKYGNSLPMASRIVESSCLLSSFRISRQPSTRLLRGRVLGHRPGRLQFVDNHGADAGGAARRREDGRGVVSGLREVATGEGDAAVVGEGFDGGAVDEDAEAEAAVGEFEGGFA